MQKDSGPNSSWYFVNILQWKVSGNMAYLKDAVSEFMGNILKRQLAPQSIISQIVCRFPVTDAVHDIQPKRV